MLIKSKTTEATADEVPDSRVSPIKTLNPHNFCIRVPNGVFFYAQEFSQLFHPQQEIEQSDHYEDAQKPLSQKQWRFEASLPWNWNF